MWYTIAFIAGLCIGVVVMALMAASEMTYWERRAMENEEYRQVV